MTTVASCKFSLERPDLLRAHASAYYFDPHLHDTFSVVILTKGCVSLESPRWRNIVYEGDVFLFNPFEVHAGGSRQRVAEYDVLYPSTRFVTDSLGLPAERLGFPSFRTDVLRKCAKTQALLESLRTPDGASATVETALQSVLRECSLDPAGAPEKATRAVRVACQVIHDMYMKPIGTDVLAAYARLNKCHFIRVFHRVTGLAPQSYMRQVRLARARELICTGAELVEVAQSTGFSDQAHLTREFKKVHGVTPGCLSRDLHRRPA
jgi:AraC-like DNA-binding protein